jgi:hypothetical protein
LKAERQKKGELYRTKSEAVAAAEKIAKRSKDGLIVLVEPKPRPRGRIKRALGAYRVEGGPSGVVPRQRFRKRNPATPQMIAQARMTPTEKAARLRNWAAGHSIDVSLS